MKRLLMVVLVALLALSILPAAQAQDAVPVRIVLKWVTQAQFAGYYAAEALGYYEEEGIDAEIIAAGVDISPLQLVAAGDAELGINWSGGLLSAREAGEDLVIVSQIYQTSGMRQITWADTGLETFDALAGMTVGVWPGENALPTFAALTSAGLDPENPDDVNVVGQAFDMNAFLNREIDAASAMTYNELAQVLETPDADGNLQYTLEDLNVLDFNENGTAMLEDHIFGRADWVAENEEAVIAFLRASYRGWAYCRDNAAECVDIVLEQGTALGAGHQAWMMNEVNKLVWPSPNGVGIMDADLWQQSVDVALEAGFISADPGGEGVSYRNDLAQAALDSLMADFPDLDLMGTEWEAPVVEVTVGGE
jgi:NitT/TauT family transport system substrate-binding protein